MTSAIKDVLLVTGNDEPPLGYVKIPVDLNKGVGGAYIYLCYSRSGDHPAITDFKVKMGGNSRPDPGYEFVLHTNGNPLDLNKGAGGEYIYLTYTRNPGTPVVDLLVQAWNHPASDPGPPIDDRGIPYERIDGELNKGSGGAYIYANQMKRQPDSEPPKPFSLSQFVDAFTKHTIWEISRAQVGEGKVGVWKVRVEGEKDTVSTALPLKVTLKTYRGMKETDATEVVDYWEISGGMSGELSGKLGKLAANVGFKLGKSTKTTHTFETSEWQERDAEMTIPADPTHPGGSQTGFYIAVVDVLETHDMRGHVLSSDVSYSGEYGVGYQSGATLDPSHAVHFLPLGSQVFRPTPGTFYRIAAKHSGKVLDVGGSAAYNGAGVIQWDWCNGLNQQWTFTDLGNDTYMIKVRHTGKCLDVNQESQADGAAVHQWDWWGGNNQKWQAVPQPDGTIAFRALHSGKFLDVKSKDMGNGAVLQQWTWLAGDNQKWLISPV